MGAYIWRGLFSEFYDIITWTISEKVKTIPVATEPILKVASLRGWRDSFARGATNPASYAGLTR